MSPIFLAGKKAQKRPPLQRDVISDRPTQHGICRFQSIQYRPLRYGAFYLELDFVDDVGQRPKVLWKLNADCAEGHI
jgi:hypothetical protein